MSQRLMKARDAQEHPRVATPLELYFDLIYVVAIAAITGGLHHALVEHHFASGLWAFVVTLFSVWWAWMNFTWFASAYDNDDVPYRLATMVQMFGSLIMAAGVPDVFQSESWLLTVVGYVVMRVAMVYQWLRAAKHDPVRQKTCHRYALGIVITQILWVLMLLLPVSIIPYVVVILILAELAVPTWAEKVSPTTWHPHHIAERYGLLVIIILGEGVMGALNSVRPLLHMDVRWLTEAFPLGLGISALMFALWWLYFKMPWAHLLERNYSPKMGFLYGYSHYFVFGSLVAVGAALELVADSVSATVATNHQVAHDAAHSVSPLFAMTALAIAVALYLTMVTMLRARLTHARNYPLIGYVGGIIATFLAVLTTIFGLPLQWSIWLMVVAPVVMIALYRETDVPAHGHH